MRERRYVNLGYSRPFFILNLLSNPAYRPSHPLIFSPTFPSCYHSSLATPAINNADGGNPPRMAPMTPTTRFPIRLKPCPVVILPVSHPAARPINREQTRSIIPLGTNGGCQMALLVVIVIFVPFILVLFVVQFFDLHAPPLASQVVEDVA